jgi:hypothetical protein
MKRLLIASFAVFFLGGISMTQDSTPPPEPTTAQPQTSQPQTPEAQSAPANPQAQQPGRQPGQQPAENGNARRISPGTVIPVQLSKSVDAKKIKSGDEVVAKVTQDLKTTSGEVVVPKDTKVVGHVTAAQTRSKEQKESDVGIAFDHAVLKDGSEIKMPSSIQAIIAPAGTTPNGAGNGGGSDQPATPSGGGMPQSGGVGRPGGMGGNTAPPTPSPQAGSDNVPTNAQTAGDARGPITAKTQGVIGISNLKLSTAAPNSEQGSLVSSEKNNVKLDSGTLMLLRVN